MQLNSQEYDAIPLVHNNLQQRLSRHLQNSSNITNTFSTHTQLLIKELKIMLQKNCYSISLIPLLTSQTYEYISNPTSSISSGMKKPLQISLFLTHSPVKFNNR